MSGPVDLGETYRYRFPVTTTPTSGILVNAGTVTATITLPDGSTASPIVVNSSTGIYDIAYTTTQAGLHNMVASATGGTLGTEVSKTTDAFTVNAPGRMLIGVDEALEELNATQVITGAVNRDRMRRLCMSVTETVERELDRAVVPVNVTNEAHNGGVHKIFLRKTPVISVSSITASGVAVTDYQLDNDTGELAAGTTSYASRFTYGLRNVLVSYRAGFVVPPWDIRERALDLIQARWQSSQQRPAPFVDESFEGGLPVGGPTPAPSAAYLSYRSAGVA